MYAATEGSKNTTSEVAVSVWSVSRPAAIASSHSGPRPAIARSMHRSASGRYGSKIKWGCESCCVNQAQYPTVRAAAQAGQTPRPSLSQIRSASEVSANAAHEMPFTIRVTGTPAATAGARVTPSP
jgi:hypothetical protein